MPPTRTRPATSATVRPVSTATCDPAGRREPGQVAQGALGARGDARDGRIARADGQRPVEVDDDEERGRAAARSAIDGARSPSRTRRRRGHGGDGDVTPAGWSGGRRP